MVRDVVRIVGIGLVCIGLSLIGWKAATLTSHLGKASAGVVTYTSNGTVYSTRVETRTVRRVVKGKVVYRDDQVYVRVPVVVVHTHHRIIKVPQHLLPLRSAAATVADPQVTVTVEVPGPSPEPVTVTSTVTTTETSISVETTTISLPLIPTTSDQ